MKKIVLITLIVGLLLPVSVLFGRGERETDGPGRLVLYASHPPAFSDFFIARFQQQYGIDVELISGGTGELLSRIQAEAGNPQADVMWGGGADTGGSAPQLFVPFDSPALASISAEYLDPQGYNAPFAAFAIVVMYNRNLVSDDEAPQSWADLADPNLGRSIVHANPAVSGSAYTAMVNMLQVGGWNLVEALARNQIVVDSSSGPFTQVGRGENPLGITYEEGAWQWEPTGQVGIVYPSDGVVLIPEGMFKVANGPNPDNARLFMEFMLAQETQTLLANEFRGRRPTHRNANLPAGMPPAEELNVLPYPREEAAANRAEWIRQWQGILERLN